MDPAAKERIRETFMADSFVLKDKQRFGLFSQPISNALGETNFVREVKPNLDEDKHVIIEPRNFFTSPMKKGKLDQQLLGAPSYNALGCPFKESITAVKRQEKKDGHLAAGHDRAFRPAKVVRDDTCMKAAYEHMNDRKEVKKNFKDEEGAVVIGPRNFFTNPPKKGEVGKGTSFAGQWEHLPDTYDQAKKNNRKTLEKHWEINTKVHEGKQFAQRSHTVGHFNSTRAVIGADIPQNFKSKQELELKSAEHERAWRPSMPIRTGQANCTIGSFPNYKENPPKELTRKRPVEGEEDDGPKFKLTHHYKSRPTPSVVTNMRNLKASFPSVFRK